MKRVFASFLAVTIVAASCTKQSRRADDVLPVQTQAQQGIEDNLLSRHGGGDNISASSVPAAVMNKFKAQFPAATRTEWKKLSNGNFKVQFFLGSVRWEAIYTPTGTRVKLERA